MTETEAKTKWCPFVRIIFGPQTSNAYDNRGDGGEVVNNPRCIASECMAWRVTNETYDIPTGTETVSVGGFCGLAGKP